MIVVLTTYFPTLHFHKLDKAPGRFWFALNVVIVPPIQLAYHTYPGIEALR